MGGNILRVLIYPHFLIRPVPVIKNKLTGLENKFVCINIICIFVF